MNPVDAQFMARALQLAAQGLYTTHPNPRVGCVLVNDGRSVGEGAHLYAGEAHAEVHALHAAGTHARGATAYVTLEPCCHHGRTPPCTQALIDAGVARVVAAMEDPNPRVAGKGVAALRAAGIAVEIGLMQSEAERLNPGFTRRMRTGRPFVRSKLAASLDGRTALQNGASRWITGEAARADVQHWRARSSAIVTGIGTVLADDPALNVRAFPQRVQPVRVVVDSKLQMPPQAQMLRLAGKTVIASALQDAARVAALQAQGAEVLQVAGDADGIDLAALFAQLATREANEVWVEAGARLNGALLARGLIDELVIYFAPHILGSDARAMFVLPALTEMAERTALSIDDVRRVGADWRIVARVERGD